MEITRTIWQKVYLPTIALGLLWIVHSLATTAYVPWQNSRQRVALAGNLAAIDQVLQVSEDLWQLQAVDVSELDADSRETPLTLCDEILRTLGPLRKGVDDMESQALLVDLEGQVEKIRRQMHDAADRDDEALVAGSASEVAALMRGATGVCNRLLNRCEHLLLDTVEERSQTDVLVMIVRVVLLAMGLAVGIGLAWWIAQGINRTLSQIVVSLQGLEGDLPVEIGRIDVVSASADHDLDSVQKQVAGAIRHVGDKLKQARREMVRAERLAAVGELAAGVAHEIRNPLTSVKLIVQRAAERVPVHSLNEEQLAVLLEEVSRIETTVQGLLDFAHPTKPQRAPCDLAELVRRTLNLVAGRAEQSGIEICTTLEPSPERVEVEVDAGLIQQVIVNLLINALDSTPRGGRLQIGLRRESDEVVLQVRDSGSGISPVVFERMFEPFVTTKARGSGLGLAISRRIVQEHQGTLVASNEVGGGAMFTVRLPARLADAAPRSTNGAAENCDAPARVPVEQAT